jgi:hypothetical protein
MWIITMIAAWILRESRRMPGFLKPSIWKM